jgi:hypothetical protein
MNKKLIPGFLITALFISVHFTFGSELYGRLSCSQKAITFSFQDSGKKEKLELIRPDKSGSYFERVKSCRRFVVWGFNYDHDTSGRLLEDYWLEEWGTVEQDFREMKNLGANVVRIHLQLPKFMNSAEKVNKEMLKQLKRLTSLAERVGLYLDITGLGCYHKKDVPGWYDALNEAERWTVQCLFWGAIAKICNSSPSVFCYDLMNEPILPAENKPESEWLAGEFGGEYFVQRITLDLAGRTSSQVAKTWVDKLVPAIREFDKKHMITIGEIPWSYSFPGAKPFFYSEEVGKNLDFVSVHFYPKKDDTANALKALRVYEVGKPILIEEIFPLSCSIGELDAFIEGSRSFSDGWIGFYWGHSLKEYEEQEHLNISDAIIKGWLEYFQDKTFKIIGSKEK